MPKSQNSYDELKHAKKSERVFAMEKNKKTLKRMLLERRAIEDAYLNGAVIEFHYLVKPAVDPNGSPNWVIVTEPSFCWNNAVYRIRKHQINWDNVPRGTSVLVGYEEQMAMFIAYMPHMENPYLCYTGNTKSEKATFQHDCKLDPNVKIKEEWLIRE